MATVNVRRLDDDVARRLKRRAEANNRSLESEARSILAAAEDDAAVKRKSFGELSARLRRMTRGRAHTPSEVLVRKDRDGGHRKL